MKRAHAASAPKRAPIKRSDEGWRERAAELYVEFERPARALVRRAFRGAFAEDELDDIYSTAWVGTLRSLASRHGELSDDEVRSYVLTAVANQASRELRRRRRKPTAPLELIEAEAEGGAPPEIAASAEASRVTRDLLASMPPRRRAVILLRYGWGLEPAQVRGLIGGLSARAYRKEITKGVGELTEKLGALERGEWCSEREPLLVRYAAGLADEETERQARAHLSHCRECAALVAGVRARLHDAGGALVSAGALEELSGRLSIPERGLEAVERAREALAGLLHRGAPPGADELATGLAAAGAGRGAGVAGAGLLAKLSGLAVASKISLVCLGGGAATCVLVAAGVTPIAPPGLTGGGAGRPDGPGAAPPMIERIDLSAPAAPAAPAEPDAAAGDAASQPRDRSSRERDGAGEQSPSAESGAGRPAPAPAPVVEGEFGVVSAAPGAASPPASGEQSAASTVREQFGP